MSERATALLKNASTNVFRYFLNIVILLVLTPFIIHTLGKDDYGLWNLVFSLIGFFGLMDFGFATSVVKYIAEARGSGDYDRMNRLASTLFFTYCAIAVAAMALIVGASVLFPTLFRIPPSKAQLARFVLIIMGFRLAYSMPFGMFRGVLYGHQAMYVANIVKMLSLLFNAGLTYIVLSLGGGLIGLAMVTLTTTIVTFAVYTVLAFRRAPQLSVRPNFFDRALLRETTSFSFFMFLTNIGALILTRSDAIIIKSFLTLADVAVYSVALRISENAYLLGKQFTNAMTPLVAELKGAGDEERISRSFLEGSRLCLAFMTPVLAGLIFFADPIIPLWVGDEFRGSIPVVRILLTAVFFSLAQTNASNVLAMTGRHKFVAIVIVVGALFNVAVSIVLIRFLGLIGVALGTLIAALCVDMFVLVRRACAVYEVSMFTYALRVLVPPIGNALLMAGALWFLQKVVEPRSLIIVALEAGLGVLFYGVTFFTVWMSKEERTYYLDRVMRLVKRRLRG